MRTAAAVRVAAALSLAFASHTRADDPKGPAAPVAKPASAVAAAPQRRAAVDPGKRPPPAVIMIPLVGLVLLPLTLPVAEPRSRQAPRQGDAQPPGASTGADAAAKAPAPLVPPSGDGVAATEPAACPRCAAPQQPADQGAHP